MNEKVCARVFGLEGEKVCACDEKKYGEGGVLVLERSDDHGKFVREATPAFRAFPRFEKKLVHLGHTRLT